jgi:hypothetical protein
MAYSGKGWSIDNTRKTPAHHAGAAVWSYFLL